MSYLKQIFAAILLLFIVACSDSDEVAPPSGNTWEDYYETFSDGTLTLIYNEDTISGNRVVISGIEEGKVYIAPKNLIFGLSDIQIEADASEVDSGYILSATVMSTNYTILLEGFVSDSEQLFLEIEYQITDSILGEWLVPTGRLSDAAEFTIESEYDNFMFLGDSLNQSALSLSVNIFLETLVKRYVKNLTFNDDGTCNVIYYGRDEQEGTLPDGLLEYFTLPDTAFLGVDLNYLDQLDENQLKRLDTFLELTSDGFPMTKLIGDNTLELTLERETLVPILIVVEATLQRLSDSGEDVNEILLQAISDLNVIIFSCTEFDMTLKLEK